MNQKDYIRLSLELHLFFDRIMKEHSFFLETAFMEKNKELKEIANDFQQLFASFLTEATNLSNGQLSKNILNSDEFITKNTKEVETKSSNLSGVKIDSSITEKELNLKSGNIEVTEGLLTNISNLNRKTLPAIQNLIYFKNDILNRVLSCNIYTTNNPLLITHIMNEAKMYCNLLYKIETKDSLTKKDIYNQELFWNNIMKEHAEFIRGLLDPSEKDLIETSNKYAKEYEQILKRYQNSPSNLTNTSLQETISFRDFKIAGEEGILNCKIKSIIIPLLADHVLREANHFIRILKNISL
ncbi:MAG: DUF2935 domain-containing protein [Erysipelotrichaceae bacterium]|nr:DUF2935 domain-containing protein [Erysipelotrichaceae bacterium]